MSDHFETLVFTCGDEVRYWNLSNIKAIKILGTDSRPLSKEALTGLKAQFTDQNGNHSPQSSSKGCLAIPSGATELRVTTSVLGQMVSAATSIDKNLQSYRELSLLPQGKLAFELACPADGLFAGEMLSLPIRLDGADAPNVSWKVMARGIDDDELLTLFSKPFGIQQSLPKSLNISHLDPGSYQIQVFANNLIDTLKPELKLMPLESTCLLTVIRTKPTVNVRSDQAPLIVASGDELPWMSTSNESLHVCIEHLPPEAVPAAAKQCEAPSYCLSPRNFTKVERSYAESSGVYNYFLKKRNRIGEESKVSCQTVIVNNHEPLLQVHWADPKLKADFPILSEPLTTLKAKVDVSHPTVPKSFLEANLQCKVRFYINSMTQVSGRAVRCISERCDGLPMDDYVPCDKMLAMDISDIWPIKEIKKSRLELQVRVDDGVGHRQEQVIPLYLFGHLWKIAHLSHPGMERHDPYLDEAQLIQGPKEKIWKYTRDLKGYGAIAKLDGRRWMPIPPPSELYKDLVQFVIRQDGRPFAIWARRDEDNAESDCRLMTLDDDNTWNDLPHPNHISFSRDCKLGIKADNRNGIWVFAPSQLWNFSNSNWSDYGAFSDGDAPYMNGHIPSSIKIVWAQNGTIWMMVGRYLFTYEHGKWKSQLRENQIYFSLTDMIEDSQGRIWLFASAWEGMKPFLGYYDEDEFTNLSDSVPSEKMNDTDRFALWHKQVVLGEMVWEDATDTWKHISDITTLTTGENITFSILQSGDAIACDASGVRLYDREEQLSFWPFPAWADGQFTWNAAHDCNNLIHFSNGSWAFLTENWAYFTVEKQSWFELSLAHFWGDQPTSIAQIHEYNGEILATDRNQGIFKLEAGTWINHNNHFPRDIEWKRSQLVPSLGKFKAIDVYGQKQQFWIKKGDGEWQDLGPVSQPGSSLSINTSVIDKNGSLWLEGVAPISLWRYHDGVLSNIHQLPVGTIPRALHALTAYGSDLWWLKQISGEASSSTQIMKWNNNDQVFEPIENPLDGYTHDYVYKIKAFDHSKLLIMAVASNESPQTKSYVFNSTNNKIKSLPSYQKGSVENVAVFRNYELLGFMAGKAFALLKEAWMTPPELSEIELPLGSDTFHIFQDSKRRIWIYNEKRILCIWEDL